MNVLKGILLIDDNRFLNLLNFNMIKSLGIAEEVHVVKNGYEALDFLDDCLYNSDKTLPELILLDLIMPELDGRGFLNYFKKYVGNGRCKVIVLSSYVDQKEIDELKELGVVDIIFKPLKDQILIETIKKIFPEKQLQYSKSPRVDY